MVCLQEKANIPSVMRNPVPGGCRPVLLGYLLCNLLMSCAQTQHDDWRGVTGVFNPANDAVSGQTTSAPSPAMQAAEQAQDVQTRIFLTAIDTTFTEDPRARASDLRAAGLNARARALSNPLQPTLSLEAETFNDGVRLQASQPLIEFGRRSARIEELEAQGNLERVDLAATRSEILTEALSAVLEYESANQKIVLHRDRIAKFTELHDTATRLSELNLLTAADVNLTLVELQGAQIDLERANNDLTLAINTWQRLGTAQAIPRNIRPSYLRELTQVNTLLQAQARSHTRSLSVRSLIARRAQLSAELTTAQRQNRPTISAVVSSTLLQTDSDHNVGVALVYPLFRRETKDDAAEVRAQLVAIDAEIDATRETLDFEIGQHSTTASQLRGLISSKRSSLSLLRQRVEDLEFQVEKGLASYVDLIEAQVDVFEAELSILEYENQALQSDMAILLMTGALIP